MLRPSSTQTDRGCTYITRPRGGRKTADAAGYRRCPPPDGGPRSALPSFVVASDADQAGLVLDSVRGFVLQAKTLRARVRVESRRSCSSRKANESHPSTLCPPTRRRASAFGPGSCSPMSSPSGRRRPTLKVCGPPSCRPSRRSKAHAWSSSRQAGRPRTGLTRCSNRPASPISGASRRRRALSSGCLRRCWPSSAVCSRRASTPVST